MRTPAPVSVTRRALSGLSQLVGTTTIGTPLSAAASTVALPPTVTSAAHRGSSSPWLEPARDVDVGRRRAPSRERRWSRWFPVVMITSTGSAASASIDVRSRNGSPKASVLSVTCTHGRVVGIFSSHRAVVARVRVADAVADVVNARREVAAAVVELADVADQVERQARGVAVDRLAERGQPVACRADLIDPAPHAAWPRARSRGSARCEAALPIAPPGGRSPKPKAGASGPGISGPMNVEDERHRDRARTPTARRSAPTATGPWRSRPAATGPISVAQVRDLVRDRVDQPVAHDRQQPAAAGPRAAVARVDRPHRPERPLLVEALEPEAARSPARSIGSRAASPL